MLAQLHIDVVDGVLLDLGLSSDQLADAQRGFSFSAEGELDLRFDPEEGEPAWRLVERLSAEHLAELFYYFGEERHSRKIARTIVERRRQRPIRTSADLAELVRRCVPSRRGRTIDPATKTFQALRIAVNDELKSLELALRRIPDHLRVGGKAAIISFHSLEDRLVKDYFRLESKDCICPPRQPICTCGHKASIIEITRRPITPTDEERNQNSRARSAKLRVAEKLSAR